MLERLRIITSWPTCTGGLAKRRTAAKLWIRSRALRKRRVTWKKCGEISPIAPATRLYRRANTTKATPRAITAQHCCRRAPMKGHLGRDPGCISEQPVPLIRCHVLQAMQELAQDWRRMLAGKCVSTYLMKPAKVLFGELLPLSAQKCCVREYQDASALSPRPP